MRDDEGSSTTIRAPEASADGRAHTEPDVADLVRDQQIGRYRLVARLGAGAMGVVWSAIDPQLDRKVAIKVVHPSLSRAPDASSRLLREARAMAKLSHRSVVTVHDAGELDGRLFLAMELVSGTNLGAMLRARNADAIADWPRWLALVIEAGRGLAAAHRANVLHRDFKPDNVLVDEAGRVCVGDFGLATLGDDARAELSERWSSQAIGHVELTMTGALLGTPGYMSPQQLRGGAVDARADQFSFCVATWEALYGARPFQVQERGLDALPALAELIDAGVLPDPPPGSTVPDAVRDVLRRGLAADPAARWPDMDAVLDALLRASDRSLPGLSSVDAVVAPREPERHLRLTLGIVAAVAAVVIAGVVLATYLIGKREPPLAPAPSLVAQSRFGIGLRATMALTPDGKRVALGGDTLQVRSVDGNDLWSTQVPRALAILHIEVDDRVVRFGSKFGESIHRWAYAENGVIEVERELAGRWFGSTARGELAYAPADNALLVIDGTREVLRRATTGSIEVVGISPDRTRVAYIEADRFTGRIFIWDLVHNAAFDSGLLVTPTALAWLDDTTVVYATGTHHEPTVHRARVTARTFGTATPIYRLASGWFGQLAANGGRLLVTHFKVTSRVRMLDRNGGGVRDSDASEVAAPLGWTSPTEFLAWSRATGRVDRRHMTTGTTTPTPYRLDAEPANATQIDSTLIVTLRRSAGRETIAFGPDGAVLWRHSDLRTFAVRCAGDRQAPCFAIRTGTRDTIVPLDPRTGALAATLLYTGAVEDIAVSEDGSRILVARPSAQVAELDASGQEVALHDIVVASRSIAIDPQGGFLVGGTRQRNRYQVGRMRDGTFTELTESDNDVLSFVRPSPDGNQLFVLVRVYSPPDVYELLPAR